MKQKATAQLILLAIIWSASWSIVPAQRRESSEPNETLIRNATVLTITHGTLAYTFILIRRGKIGGFGKGL
jgi:hypothetical protein